MRRALLAPFAFASLLPLWLLFPACSSDVASGSAGSPAQGPGGSSGQGAQAGGSSGQGQTGGSGGSGGSGGAAAQAGSPGQGGSAGSGVSLDDGGTPEGGSPFEGCAKGGAEAKPLPLDLYVMLDQSASMAGPRWAAVTQALTEFVSSGGGDQGELGMGLQFFPLPGGKTCSYQAYAAPEVPIAPLPGNADPITKALAAHTPAGETPTLPALQGAYELAKGWAGDHPGRTVAVVLATDGEPNVCGSTIDNAKAVAENARGGDQPVSTFVVGVGESLTALDAIAQAGGSSKAFLVDGSGGATKEQFLAALAEIRGAALSCELTIPAPESGTLDPSLVNVTFTPPGGQPQVFSHVDAMSGCADSASSWYYDNPTAPTHVVLCEATCKQVKAKAGGKVDVVFGCATIVK